MDQIGLGFQGWPTPFGAYWWGR